MIMAAVKANSTNESPFKSLFRTGAGDVIHQMTHPDNDHVYHDAVELSSKCSTLIEICPSQYT